MVRTLPLKSRPILVSHVGRRDSYELALALTGSGRPVHLITDFYYQPGTWVGRAAKFIFGSSVGKRHHPDLEVVIHPSALLFVLDLAERVWPRNKIINRLRGYTLGQKSVQVARREGVTDAYFYSNSGIRQFVRSNQACRINLFQMHPHADALVDIYRRYMTERPQMAKLLTSQEEELTGSRRYLSRLASEAREADRVICTSKFVKSTLLTAGVQTDDISVVPYGTRRISTKARPVPLTGIQESGPHLRLAFVGQYVIRKGVYELATFAKNSPNVEVNIFTREAKLAQALTKTWLGTKPHNMKFHRILDDAALWKAASSCDFLILPSLAEGFGLVISEAMSHGLPVISTRNSAAPDLVVDGLSGFLMDDVFAKDITNTVNRALERRTDWPDLRKIAHSSTQNVTWQHFRVGIRRLANPDAS